MALLTDTRPRSFVVTVTKPAKQPLEDAAASPRNNQGGRLWRAFLHVRAEGKLNREVLAELSAAYQGLSDEDYQSHVALRRYAMSQRDLGQCAFGASRWQGLRTAEGAARHFGCPEDGEPDNDGAEEDRRPKLDDALSDMFFRPASTVLDGEGLNRAWARAEGPHVYRTARCSTSRPAGR